MLAALTLPSARRRRGEAATAPCSPAGWYRVVCPAPFTGRAIEVDDGAELRLRYTVVIADGEPDAETCAALAGPILQQ
ncbi:hypothetical protein [Dactylosporangium sp. CA-092794]|uniref:hypothetical protein n=1 Tax=Dactylosporangium sp. CA-092794 TaxID=3239929 RepID=UPI003D8FF491